MTRQWRRVVPALAAAAFVLGFASFMADEGGLGAVPAAALLSLQLFVINVGPEQIHGVAGWIAAILAPLATAGAAVYAFGERAWRAWQLLRLRFDPADDLFVGGGETAAGVAVHRARMLLAAAGGRARGRLVGVDLREDAPLARVLQDVELPGFVLTADALAEGALRPLQPHRAGNVWVLTGDDHRNLELAWRVRRAIESAAGPAGRRPVRLLVEVRDRRLLRAADALSGGLDAARLTLDFFSLPRLAARALLREHPPLPCGVGARAPHLLVIGSGELAAALVVHAAQHCVYDEDPAHCVRITLAGPDASAMLARLQRAFPALAASSPDPMLAALLPLARIEALDCDEAGFVHADWLRLQREQAFDVVYVACERDLDTMAAARRAATMRELTPGALAAAQPIVACVQQPAESTPALAQEVLALHGLVQRFDLHARCFREDEGYPGERQDRRAMIVHAVHELPEGEAFTASPERVREAAGLWAGVRQEDFRWSDRLAADHVDLKLDLLACASRDAALRDWRAWLGADPQRIARAVEVALRTDAGMRETLARLEHRRFVAERLLEGWLPLPATLRNRGASGLPASMQKSVLRTSHTLVPFDRLREADPDVDLQAYDLKVVDAIPGILRAEAMLRDALAVPKSGA